MSLISTLLTLDVLDRAVVFDLAVTDSLRLSVDCFRELYRCKDARESALFNGSLF